MRIFAVLLLPLLLAACAPPPPAPPPPPSRPFMVAAPARIPFHSSPELEALRDPRPARPAGSRAFLVSEIRGLTALFDATPRDAADRPKLISRLAADYAEVAREAALEGQHERIVVAARRAAIIYHYKLAYEYPTWCYGPASGCADQTLYYLGFEFEKDGQIDNARKVYVELITKYPASRFAPFGYLAFGELFLPEAAQDPSRWTLAQQSFEEVIKAPPPNNPLYGYALLRLAQIDARLGRAGDAQARRAELRDLAARFPGWAAAEIPARVGADEAP